MATRTGKMLNRSITISIPGGQNQLSKTAVAAA
jgi:hypothetical protein